MSSKQITYKEIASSKIFYDILNGNFDPNEFLTEKELMERYQISKAPIREALVELCNEKILRSIPRLGYQLVPLTEKNIMDITQLRLLMELSAFKKTITIFNDEMLEKLIQLNRDWELQVRSTEISMSDRWLHNTLFHTTLASFSGNQILSEVLGQMVKREYQAYAQLFWHQEQQKVLFYMESNLHVEMEKVLREKDFDKATEFLRNDIVMLCNMFVSKQDVFEDFNI